MKTITLTFTTTLHPKANWIAQDADGEWHQYVAKPCEGKEYSFWRYAHNEDMKLPAAICRGPANPNWKETLQNVRESDNVAVTNAIPEVRPQQLIELMQTTMGEVKFEKFFTEIQYSSEKSPKGVKLTHMSTGIKVINEGRKGMLQNRREAFEELRMKVKAATGSFHG